MQKRSIPKHHQAFVDEVENEFQGKEQGYVKSIKVGSKLFPYSLPPQLEIVLLDPEDQTIVYRPASNPDSKDRKKGDWEVGKPIDAVKYVLDWADKMKQLK
jgi:hypothetical protein